MYNIASTENLVIGGITYIGTANDWSANFFNDVNGTAGLPFQAFIAGTAAQLIYDMLMSGSKANTLSGRLQTAVYTGMGAMVGGVAGTLVAGANAAPVGAALGSIYFKFGSGSSYL